MNELAGAREWVYTAWVDGHYRRLRRATSLVLIAFLFGLPWMRIRGLPALELDLQARTLYAFGGVFRPTDSILLVIATLMLGLVLFLSTALWGRIWCGYACPQTVFLEEWVRALEHRIEGSRGVRRARDQGPWTWDKAWRKALKWSLFLLAAFVLSMSLVSFLTGAPDLWSGQVTWVAWAWVGSLTAIWFADFAWFREQLCNYLCPYARIQGALTDDESLVVSYDRRRGEPRKVKGEAWKPGSCISCDRCVVVCPAGIDIREGYQLECVNCARCVDACTGVMDRLGHPTLVRYTTQAEEEGRRRRVLRPRTAAYGSLLGVLALALVVTLATSQDLEVTVNRAPGSLYTIDSDGAVRNTYLVRVANTSGHGGAVEEVTIEVSGLPEAEVLIPPIGLRPDEDRTVPMIIRMDPGQVEQRTTDLVVTVTSGSSEVHRRATFKAPNRIGQEG